MAEQHHAEQHHVSAAAEAVAAAIGRRDLEALRARLAPDFIHRIPGGAASDLAAFLRGIEQIPGEIRFVRLERMDIDLTSAGALVTGIQHAQVVVDGEVIDDRRGFLDWFVKIEGEWRIQVAVDLPDGGSAHM